MTLDPRPAMMDYLSNSSVESFGDALLSELEQQRKRLVYMSVSSHSGHLLHVAHDFRFLQIAAERRTVIARKVV